jgi:hypothetical protein
VPLVEQELLTLPYHMSSPPVFSGVRVTRCLVLCVCFVDRGFILAIVLSVLLRFTDYGYPFGIFKLCLRFLSQDEVRFVALINGIILAIKSLLNFVFNVLFSRCEWVSRWMIVVYAVWLPRYIKKAMIYR